MSATELGPGHTEHDPNEQRRHPQRPHHGTQHQRWQHDDNNNNRAENVHQPTRGRRPVLDLSCAHRALADVMAVDSAETDHTTTMNPGITPIG